jgi:hypothetical protein
LVVGKIVGIGGRGWEIVGKIVVGSGWR